MIEVTKGPEPDGLRLLREEMKAKGLPPKAAFEELRNPLKEEVLGALLRDQGQLCVYCMSRIPRRDKGPGIPGTTIEHFIPLELPDGQDEGQALDYQNLFAVCHGNTQPRKKGVPRHTREEALTCDKHRGNHEFHKIHPLRKETLESISYNSKGEIDAADPDVKRDLTEILNLNSGFSPLMSERKAVLDALTADMGDLPKEELRKYCTERLEAFQSETDKKTPFVGVIIWYLRSTLEAL